MFRQFTYHRFLLIIFLASILADCTRVSEIGDLPQLQPLTQPQLQADYRPLNAEPRTIDIPQLTNPNLLQYQSRTDNSLMNSRKQVLFRNKARHQLGDIINVVVKINDQASISNKTDRTRGDNKEKMSIPNLAGLTPYIQKILPSNSLTDMLSLESSGEHSGDGKIDRSEKIATEIASVVTQILPNGNLVIIGTQQIRINRELREIELSGIVSPEDIDANNSVLSDQIAEAKISYGGRGIISDVQKPRLINELVDLVAPF